MILLDYNGRGWKTLVVCGCRTRTSSGTLRFTAAACAFQTYDDTQNSENGEQQLGGRETAAAACHSAFTCKQRRKIVTFISKCCMSKPGNNRPLSDRNVWTLLKWWWLNNTNNPDNKIITQTGTIFMNYLKHLSIQHTYWRIRLSIPSLST